MQIHVIRGAEQIGGSIIEVASDRARIILDVGSELGERVSQAPDVEGLFAGSAAFDGVLISHYHSDHIGLLDDVVPGMPIYMGAKTFEVYKAQRAYAGTPVRPGICTFESGETFRVGDIQATPLLCDHSSFDSFMFLLEAGGETVLYTGDFRSNGRKSFERLLAWLPKVNKLIVEGTTLSGNHALARTEADLESEAVRFIRGVGSAPVFVNMASTNTDRIVTFFRAAKRTGRVFLEDSYTASITAAIGGSIPNPAFPEVKVFLTRATERDYGILQRFDGSKIGRASIARERFLMMVRPSMVGYLEKLSQLMDFRGGLLFYSLWSGYKDDDRTKEFLERMEALGLRVVDLHTSGHADARTLERLIQKTDPDEIVPVHTENPTWFERFSG